jgi:hypothetical protein
MQMSSNISLLFKVPQKGFHIPEKRPQIPDTLLYDIRNFARVHPELSNRQAAEAFLDRWVGYKAKYSLELVTAGFKMVRE